MSDLIPSFGALPSKDDVRTVNVRDLNLAKAVLPPSSYHIDYSGLPHDHQRKVGICTACAVGAAVEKFLITKGLVPPDWRASKEWFYKMGKVLVDGNTYEGSSAFTMLKCAQKYGVPSESKFPSNLDRSYEEFIKNTTITEEMLADAALHKIPGYGQVSVDQMSLMKALYDSISGLIIRMECGDNWWTDEFGNITWEKSKLCPLRVPKQIISGHLLVKTGYETEDAFTNFIRNSWNGWCGDGNAFFDFATQKPYFTEAWTIVDKVLFTRDLKLGTTHSDVKRWQVWLNTHGFKVAESGNGSPGFETDYFGERTRLATAKFQAAKGISPTKGYFGIITRTMVNSLP